ncbi:MAG: nucleotidyltransferase family protein [Bacteroidetes bacterium]|nr:nucleotidyltransferase family protein [Fibrella sp.]
MTIGIIILAAGASRRFGGQAKQLLPVEGKTLIRRIAETALAAQLSGPIAVVLGANQELIAAELADLPVQLLDNPDWAEGMSTSLKTGLTAFNRTHPTLDAVVVLLCDQPLITPELIRQLTVAFVETGKLMIACRYNGGVGVPALFARPIFADLLALDGDKGARYLLQKRKTDVAEVDFEPAAIDLDSWDDVANWTKL